MTTTCLVVMGVSSAGKSTVAAMCATRLGWPLAEADEFHPSANIHKMTAGIPLTDDDRAPWLRAIRDWISARAAAGENTVVACSALKRAYRDILRGAASRVRFVHLHGSVDLLNERITERHGHFMPASLLDSQLADLEPLQPDEDGVTVDIAPPPERIAADALHLLAPTGDPS